MNRAFSLVIGVMAMTMTGGLHCASAVVDEHADETELTTSTTTGDTGREQRSAPRVEPSEDDGSSASVMLARAVLEGTDPSNVTSTADAGDGSRFVAGVFSGTLRVGPFVLTSHGDDDVFIAHKLADGTVDWAQAVGSKGAESGPRITFDDGRLKLVAMTKGAVDCGFGPLLAWSSETFFLCTFDANGTPKNGGAFPTGRH